MIHARAAVALLSAIAFVVLVDRALGREFAALAAVAFVVAALLGFILPAPRRSR